MAGMSRFLKNHVPKRKNAKSQLPEKYPLISDYPMDQGINMTVGKTGQFTPNGTDIESLANILKSMEGKTDDRSSIPNVRAQVYTYEITLHDFPEEESDSKEVIEKWRGCMALLLLYPLLFPADQRPVWLKAGISANQTNTFLQQMRGSISDDSLLEAFRALCVNVKHKSYPLLQMNYDCIAIPSAFGIETDYCPIPWLKPTEKYATDGRVIGQLSNPIPELGYKALQLLNKGLQLLLESKHCENVSVATQHFIDDLETAANDAYWNSEVEQTLLKALLLRNALGLDIHVVEYTPDSVNLIDNGSIASQGPSLRYAKVRKVIDTLQSEAQYAVLLGKKVVAYLNSTDLLWCPTPKLVAEQQEYADLYALLYRHIDQLENGIELTNLLRYQVHRLASHPWNSPALIALQSKYQPLPEGKKNISISWKPRPVAKDEVGLERTPFSPMRLLARIGSTSDKLFADKMMLFEQRKSQASSEKNLNIRKLPSTDNSKEYITFTPLGELGAKMFHQYRQLEIDMEKRENAADALSVRVNLCYRDNIVNYIATRDYVLNKNLEIYQRDNFDFPSVALWPNVQSNPRDTSAWRIFYAFVMFHLSEEAWDLRASAYDYDGNLIDDTQQTCHDEQNVDGRRRWQTFASSSRPSFILFRNRGDIFGMLSFDDTNAKILPDQTRDLILCFDYGTTSTIGEVYDPERKISHRFNLRDARDPENFNMLKWYTNGAEGVLPASERFIAQNFCSIPADADQTQSSSKEKGAVLSLLRCFGAVQGKDFPDRPADQMVLHLDGNIYTMKESIDPEDLRKQNVRSSMKLALQDDENQRCVKTFITQMLQFFFLICRMEGARTVDVRYAAPLALSDGDVARLENFFEDIVRDLGTQTGFANIDKPKLASESMAVGAHFKGLRELNTLDPDRGMIVLDIGGGTSDYAFWIRKPGGMIDERSQLYCSNKLAGREMMVRVLYEFLRSNPDNMEKFITAVEDAATPQQMTTINAWTTNLRRLHSDTADVLNVLTIYVDQLLTNNPGLLEKLLADDKHCQRLIEVISFNIALLLWIARIIYVRQSSITPSAKGSRNMTLCLAGNGCIYYYALPQKRRNALLEIVSLNQSATPPNAPTKPIRHSKATSGAVQMSVLDKNNRDIKCEVVNGLRDNSIFPDKFKQGTTPYHLNAAEVEEDFFSFMSRYAQKFPKDTASQEFIKASNNQDIETNLRNMIRNSSGSISDLNQHISEDIAYTMNRISVR